MLLKRIPAVYALNAKVKSSRTKGRYKRICNYYEAVALKMGISYDQATVAEKIAKRLISRGVNIRPLSRGNLRILYVGSDESQDTGGFLQSLEKFGRVYRFTQKDGTYGHYSYTQLNAGEKRRNKNGQRLLELVSLIQKKDSLDLVSGQMLGSTMPWQVLKTLQSMGVVTVNICMDDRHVFRGRKRKDEWMGSLGLVNSLDLVLTTTPEACLWYTVEGCPAIYWPEASDPNLFYPMDTPKVYDVCFVGANEGIRQKIVRAIRKRGINVECYGNGWPNGRISTRDIPNLFASSKIVLGVGTIGYCTDFYSLKLRDFDAAISGSMYLTHANPDLELLFEIGKEIVCYKSPKECADKCVYYLSNEYERKAIAKAGLARCLREHTWKIRFEKLFQVLGFLEKSKQPANNKELQLDGTC